MKLWMEILFKSPLMNPLMMARIIPQTVTYDFHSL